MKKFLAMVLFGVLSAVLLTPAAFAWESHPVDMDKVGVDVGASDWAVEELKAAGDAGLVPSLTGNPGFQDAIIREQFAELAAHVANVIYGGDLFDMAEVEKIHFSDCDNEAVRCAASISVVTGVGDGKFAPIAAGNIRKDMAPPWPQAEGPRSDDGIWPSN